ncbi:MAG: hypothetical protein SPL39_06310 [Selenomonadaceae bacterium]|nr:hypothetical protein [Selenomonadaceae bacterium]
MASRQKKQDRQLERRDADGYPGLVPLKEIYGFELFLTTERDWHSSVTHGSELLHVYRRTGEEIVVWFKERPRTTVTTRHGMGLYYCYLTFSKRKDDYYVPLDGSTRCH